MLTPDQEKMREAAKAAAPAEYHSKARIDYEIATPPSAILALLDQVEAQGWQLVAKSLPDLDVPVWLYQEGRGSWVGGRTDCGDGWLWCQCYGSMYSKPDGSWDASEMAADDDYQPTHWKNLPPPPEAA